MLSEKMDEKISVKIVPGAQEIHVMKDSCVMFCYLKIKYETGPGRCVATLKNFLW